MLQFSTQNKIRINLYCNFPRETKFGSTYVAIFHTKQNSIDVPSHEDLFQSKFARTFLIVLGMPRQASLLSKQ